MIRVGDLDRSIAFYTEALGMELLRKHDYPDGKFTLAFLGYGDEGSNAVIELTYNWDTSSTTSAMVSATSPSAPKTSPAHATGFVNTAAR